MGRSINIASSPATLSQTEYSRTLPNKIYLNAILNSLSGDLKTLEVITRRFESSIFHMCYNCASPKLSILRSRVVRPAPP